MTDPDTRGLLIDGLVLLIADAKARKAANPESTSELRVAAAARLIVALSEPCPVPSRITGKPCLLQQGHPQDSPTRFHRYAGPFA